MHSPMHSSNGPNGYAQLWEPNFRCCENYIFCNTGTNTNNGESKEKIPILSVISVKLLKLFQAEKYLLSGGNPKYKLVIQQEGQGWPRRRDVRNSYVIVIYGGRLPKSQPHRNQFLLNSIFQNCVNWNGTWIIKRSVGMSIKLYIMKNKKTNSNTISRVLALSSVLYKL